MQKTAAFDPSRYPRTYRASIILRGALLLLLGLVMLGDLITLWRTCTGGGWESPADAFQKCGVAFAIAAGCWTLLAVFLRHRVVIAPDWIEVRGPWKTRRVLRSEISDFRLRTFKGGTTFQVRAPSLARPLAPALPVNADPDFRAWFAGLKNSDAADLADELAEIARDDSLGPTPRSRLAAAAWARRVALWLTIAACAILVWTLAFPYPRGPLLAIDAAWVPIALLICARSGGLYVLTARRNSARGNLASVLTASVIALGFRAWTDVRPVAGSGLVVASVIAGVSLALVARAASRETGKPTQTLLLHATIFTLYALGALALVNGEFDRTPGASRIVTIVAARKTSGKYSDTYFTLSQVPVDVDSTEVEVPLGVYRRHKIGDPVCLRERDGALGWHWLRVVDAADCPAS